jgi:translation initiation factor 1
VKSRVVYSTGVGRICPDCGRPSTDCQCAARDAGHEPVPEQPTARLRLEKKARGGKVVTVIHGLPNNAAFLRELAADLKRACGTGGTVQPGAVELAGDQRERIRALLTARGLVVKG